jgi:hypothetical protein
VLRGKYLGYRQKAKNEAFMKDSRNKARVLERISVLKNGVLQVLKHTLAGDFKLILCFICSLGTGIGLALSVTCLLWENASTGLSCIGLSISAICFAVFLYITWKVD